MKKLALLLSFVAVAGLGLADEAKQDEAKKTAEAAAEVSPADATIETPTAKTEEAAKTEDAEKTEETTKTDKE